MASVHSEGPCRSTAVSPRRPAVPMGVVVWLMANPLSVSMAEHNLSTLTVALVESSATESKVPSCSRTFGPTASAGGLLARGGEQVRARYARSRTEDARQPKGLGTMKAFREGRLRRSARQAVTIGRAVRAARTRVKSAAAQAP